MTYSINVDQLESDVYRSRFDDGSIEIFIGLSLIWIGVAWMFIPSISGFAGVFPAIVVAPFITWRTKFMEQRVGYVRFGPERRQWERRRLVVMLLAGVGMFVLGIAVYLMVTSGNSEADSLVFLSPGLIAFLLAALVVGIAAITGAWRMLFFAAVLIAGGVVAAVNDTSPGLPLIPAGIVAAVWGTAMLIVFVGKHPKVEQQ